MIDLEDFRNYIWLDYISYEKRNFAVGDLVLVKRRIESSFGGWTNSWVPSMDEYVGKIYQVREPRSHTGSASGIKLCIPTKDEPLPSDFSFPAYALEKLERRD